MKTRVYIFGTPNDIGGAGTKFVHTAPLLAQDYDITISSPKGRLEPNSPWLTWLRERNFPLVTYEQLPVDMSGSWGVALCNPQLFDLHLAPTLRRRGMRFAWSNEMMWHFPRELAAISLGWVDKILYTSPAQRRVLESGHTTAWRGKARPLAEPMQNPEALEGEIAGGPGQRGLPWVITGNYINPAEFPFRERPTEPRPLVIGRLSRPDPVKFPDNFPTHYEGLGLRNPRFRVMGWNDEVAANFPGHAFDDRWELIPPTGEPTVDFLHSLDLFVYQVGPRFKESWGRAVVEAALCGAIPLIPKGGGHHLENLVAHGKTGFHCRDDAEYGYYARLLEANPELRRDLARAGREWTVRTLCDANQHRALWAKVFTP